VNKVLSQADLANGFSIERFVGFCKGLGVDSINLTRLVPMGRARDSMEVLTEEQTLALRQELMARDDFERYVFSPDFYTARTMCDCLRLASDSPGLAVYPGRVQPCAQFPEINLGTATQLERIVTTDAQGKFNALRKTTLLEVSRDAVWSCPECRPAFSTLLRQAESGWTDCLTGQRTAGL
jgi:MoaA/NifB/PqqE/SkfB family radical SAM enzyme